jgi:gamma-tubulin complex component 4
MNGSLQGEILKQRSSMPEGSRGISNINGDAANKMIDGWDSIALEYSIDWPLQLLFTKETLSK